METIRTKLPILESCEREFCLSIRPSPVKNILYHRSV